MTTPIPPAGATDDVLSKALVESLTEQAEESALFDWANLYRRLAASHEALRAQVGALSAPAVQSGDWVERVKLAIHVARYTRSDRDPQPMGDDDHAYCEHLARAAIAALAPSDAGEIATAKLFDIIWSALTDDDEINSVMMADAAVELGLVNHRPATTKETGNGDPDPEAAYEISDLGRVVLTKALGQVVPAPLTLEALIAKIEAAGWEITLSTKWRGGHAVLLMRMDADDTHTGSGADPRAALTAAAKEAGILP